MVTHQDIESFLDRLSADGASHTEVGEGIWNVKPAGALDFGVVVNYSPPVVVLRVNVMEIPADAKQATALNRRLLEMNATDLLHGSYGIQQTSIVLTDASGSEN